MEQYFENHRNDSLYIRCSDVHIGKLIKEPKDLVYFIVKYNMRVSDYERKPPSIDESLRTDFDHEMNLSVCKLIHRGSTYSYLIYHSFLLPDDLSPNTNEYLNGGNGKVLDIKEFRFELLIDYKFLFYDAEGHFFAYSGV